MEATFCMEYSKDGKAWDKWDTWARLLLSWEELLLNAQKSTKTCFLYSLRQYKILGPAELTSKLWESSPRSTFADFLGSEKPSLVIWRLALHLASVPGTSLLAYSESQLHSGPAYRGIFCAQPVQCLNSFCTTTAFPIQILQYLSFQDPSNVTMSSFDNQQVKYWLTTATKQSRKKKHWNSFTSAAPFQTRIQQMLPQCGHGTLMLK